MAKRARTKSRAARRTTAGTRRTWTVLVYMAAQANADLDMHAVRDLLEMQRASIKRGVRVVVQIQRNWPARPQRYDVTHGKATLVHGNITPSGTGRAKPLEDFLLWALANRAANQYFLVLWGHSYGLGFGRDHNDALTLPELHGALDAFRRTRGRALELLGANACAMSYAEAAFELRHVADHLLASQIAVPMAGWPYESILSSLRPIASPVEVGRLVIERYVSSFGGISDRGQVSLTLLRLDVADVFRTLFTALAKAVTGAVVAADPGTSERIQHIRAAFRMTAVGDVRPLIDVQDLCLQLQAFCADFAVLQPAALATLKKVHVAATDLLAFLSSSTPQRYGPSLIVLHKQHPDLKGLAGVGVFAPFVTDLADRRRLGIDDDDKQTGRRQYAKLKLVVRTPWEPLVYETLQAGLPSDILDNIEASGAISVGDRHDIAQMLAGIDSVFDVLDRRIEATSTVARGGPATHAFANTSMGMGLQLMRHDVVHSTAVELVSPAGTGMGSPAAVAAVGAAGSVAASGTAPAAAKGPLGIVTSLGASAAANAAVQATNNAHAAARAQARNLVMTASAAVQGGFEPLEGILAAVERAVHRTLTNGTFGLGPGPASFVPTPQWRSQGAVSKPADRQGDPIKPADTHGFLSKPADTQGAPSKPADRQGALFTSGPPAAIPSLTRATTLAARTAVTDLFGQVGDALERLEMAIGDAETIAALGAMAGGVGLIGPPAPMQVERAFRVVRDASTHARRTVRRVLADPLYGFGPGLDDLGTEDRRELARIGGLGSHVLRLL